MADAADPSFLVARITSTTLAAANTIADPTDPHWRASLPRLPGDAMRNDLDTRLGPDATRARDLLRPLAYAEGQGLPWEDIWAPLASRISGRTYTNDDLHWLRQHAGSYVVEATEAGRSAYRLYHQALTEHLRATTAAAGLTDTAIHQAYVDVLTARVPRTLEATRDWAHAHPYTLHHLATHAAAAGTLDPLLNDAGYLVHADPDTLLPALDAARSAPARAAAAVYRQSAHLLARLDRPMRASQLELTAHHLGCRGLAARIAGAAPDRPWQTRWSHGRRATGHQVLTGHTGVVRAVAAGALPDGTPVIISGGDDGTVRVWRTRRRHPGRRAAHRPRPARCARWRPGRCRTAPRSSSAAATTARCGCGGLADGTPVGEPLTGHDGGWPRWRPGRCRTAPRSSSAAADDGTVRVWRTGRRHPGRRAADRPRRRGERGGGRGAAGRHPGHHQRRPRRHGAGVADSPTAPRSASRRRPRRRGVAVAAGALPDGTPVIISGGGDGTVRVWRMADGTRPASRCTGHDGAVTAVAAGALPDGTPVIISGGDDGTVRVWRTADGTPAGEPMTGHDGPVTAVAAGALPDGTPVIISGGGDGTVRVWRTADGTPVGEPITGHDGAVCAVAAGALPDGTPVIISGGDDGTVRVWRTRRRHPGRRADHRPRRPGVRGGGRGAAGRHPGHHQRRRATARCGCGGWPTAPRSASR